MGAADEGLQRERGEHVQPEAETCDINPGVVAGEVVEHVAEGLVAEDEKPGQRHDETRHGGGADGVVRYAGEVVDRRSLEGAVDEEGVVMADEGKGDDADGLEDTTVNSQRRQIKATPFL